MSNDYLERWSLAPDGAPAITTTSKLLPVRVDRFSTGSAIKVSTHKYLQGNDGRPERMNYADRLASKIETCGNPSVLGLDPRIEQMPKVVRELADERAADKTDRIRRSIRIFHELVIDATADIVPAVKLQLAFYEQYGVGGMQGYVDTLAEARRANLITIADGKRNDVPATAEAYARAFLTPEAEFSADAVTISPYLGSDSMQPFIELAEEHHRGIYVLVKTSNPGSGEITGPQRIRHAGVREGVRPCQAARPIPGRKARRLCCWRRGGLHAPHCSRSCARVPSGGAAVGCRLWRTKWSREKRGTLF